jgi:hypothetical protein
VPASAENAAGAVDAANRAVSEVLDEIAAWAGRAQAGAEPRVESARPGPRLAQHRLLACDAFMHWCYG